MTTAVRANGNVLDPTVARTGTDIVTNGAEDRTRCVNLVRMPLGLWESRHLRLVAVGQLQRKQGHASGVGADCAWRHHAVRRRRPPQHQDRVAEAEAIAATLYKLDDFAVTLRGTVFGGYYCVLVGFRF